MVENLSGLASARRYSNNQGVDIIKIAKEKNIPDQNFPLLETSNLMTRKDIYYIVSAHKRKKMARRNIFRTFLTCSLKKTAMFL
jgi:hypothetical protein